MNLLPKFIFQNFSKTSPKYLVTESPRFCQFYLFYVKIHLQYTHKTVRYVVVSKVGVWTGFLATGKSNCKQ